MCSKLFSVVIKRIRYADVLNFKEFLKEFIRTNLHVLMSIKALNKTYFHSFFYHSTLPHEKMKEIPLIFSHECANGLRRAAFLWSPQTDGENEVRCGWIWKSGDLWPLEGKQRRRRLSHHDCMLPLTHTHTLNFHLRLYGRSLAKFSHFSHNSPLWAFHPFTSLCARARESVR